MESRVNDFIVNSKGHCFFCLSSKSSSNKLASVKLEGLAKLGIKELESSSSSSLHTLQNVSRYLRMDMTKVFSQKGSIPPTLLAKVERSRLKVELCEECAGLNKSFSVIFQQWEKLRLEMDCKLGLIQKKMARRVEEVGSFLNSEGDEGIKQVLEVLRMEAMEKCNSKTGNPGPRVKIQKLTGKEVKAYLRNTNDKRSSERPVEAGLEFERLQYQSNNDNPNQMESQDDDNWDIADGFQDMDTNNDDDDGDSTTGFGIIPNGSEAAAAATKNLTFAPSTSTKEVGKKNYSLNSKTGKYKCHLCSKELGSLPGFNFHYSSVHLKIRFKCNLCDKTFSQKHHYSAHSRSAHLGVRYECLVCNQQFTQKSNLRSHQRKTKCKSENDHNLQ